MWQLTIYKLPQRGETVEQLIPWLVFCAAFLLFSLVRPNGARIFIGIFFIVMALGVFLSRGRRVKLGLIGAIIFLLIITPLGVWTLPNPLMAAGLARLLTKEFPYALWDRQARGVSR